MAETSCEGRKPNDSSYRRKPNKRRETGINAKKDEASIPVNQTIVAYPDDELASFRDKIVSKNTKRRSAYAVCSPGSRKTQQTN